jgi:hypothetical protein
VMPPGLYGNRYKPQEIAAGLTYTDTQIEHRSLSPWKLVRRLSWLL